MQPYAAGSEFKIEFWEENGECPALDFLKALQKGSKGEKAAAAKLDRLLQSFASHGKPSGEERCHYLDGKNIVFELKAQRQTQRLVGFYHPCERKVVIFSHGFDKPAGNKGYRPEIERAEAIRNLLLSSD